MRTFKKLTPGLSLVEVIVSIAILSIIAGFVFSALVIGERSWRSDMGLLDVQEQARQGMHGMVREIRQKNRTTDITITTTTQSNDTIIFFMTNVTNLTKYYLSNNTIWREHNSTDTSLPNPRALAHNIANLNFKCGSGGSWTDCSTVAYVEIEINAIKTGPTQRNASFNVTERVHLRND
ncbi:PilW family protein [Candidatus Omnitrophota bacterium]